MSRKDLALSLSLVLLIGSAVAAADPIEIAPQSRPDVFVKNRNSLPVRTTGVISSSANYRFRGQTGSATTRPTSFESAGTIQAQALENPFINNLLTTFPPSSGWSFTFNTGVMLANNTFQVHTYQAQAPAPPASNVSAFRAASPSDPTKTLASCVSDNDCVGAEFYTSYVASGDDPTSNVHWIQLLYSNTRDPAQAAVYRVDNGGASSPYYDQNFAANSSAFLDISLTGGEGLDGPAGTHNFDALLLLVTGPPVNRPGQVTVYGGVDWGWGNQIASAPEPNTLLLISCGAVIAGVWRRFGIRFPVSERSRSASRRPAVPKCKSF